MNRIIKYSLSAIMSNLVLNPNTRSSGLENQRKLVNRLVMMIIFLSGIVLFNESVSAQRDYGQYNDPGPTTSKPDETYGKGGTKEETEFTAKDGATVSREDLRFKQTVWKGKDGRVRHATDGRMDIVFGYDKCGRRTSVTVFELAGGQRTQRYRVEKTYQESCEDQNGALAKEPA